MRYRVLTLLLSIVLIASCAAADARDVAKAKSPKPQKNTKVSTEFGLGVMGKYTFMNILPVGDFPHTVTTNFGVGASLQFRLNFGKVFAIQPEVVYSFSQLKFNSTTEAYKPIKVKENLVQLPVLLSLRAGIVYFNFGPVFRLMDNPTYLLTDPRDDSVSQYNLGNIVPLVTYAAGVSIKIPKNMMLDIRYTGQFADIKTPNEFIWTLDEAKQPTADQFCTRNSTIQLRFGFLF